METRNDNRLRNHDIRYHVHLRDLPATASGTRFLRTVLDPAIGAEVVLLLVDQTDFAYQLSKRNPFELRLKTGAVQTNVGPMLFLLWWVPPVSDGMPFALYEHLLNPTDHGTLEMIRTLSTQTHLHVLLIGASQTVLDCYEFENTFNCGAMLPIIEASLTGPILDFEAAKREYEQMYDLQSLFQMEQFEAPEEHSDAEAEDANEVRANAIDWSIVENAAKLAFDIWVGQPELNWAKKAFQVLVTEGLLEETDDFSRHIALFRFLVLGGIYRDFCEAAWDETSWIDYAEWCEPEDIVDRFIVGQLFARMPDWEPDEESDFSVALDRLVEAERESVVEALVKGFRGIAGLYESLWRSRVDSDDPEESFDEDEDDCFEANDSGKLKAYEWITEGCTRLADLDG